MSSQRKWQQETKENHVQCNWSLHTKLPWQPTMVGTRKERAWRMAKRLRTNLRAHHLTFFGLKGQWNRIALQQTTG